MGSRGLELHAKYFHKIKVTVGSILYLLDYKASVTQSNMYRIEPVESEKLGCRYTLTDEKSED